MDSYGFLWIPMDSYGFLWIPMDSYGILGCTAVISKFPYGGNFPYSTGLGRHSLLAGFNKG
jgi:hypothetical protein